MLSRVSIVAGAGLAFAVADTAAGLEYCVTCEGPPAMYRCVIDDTAEGPGKDSTDSLHCITEMARHGKHATCAVSRGAPFPCPGLTAVVPQPRSGPSMGAVPHSDGPQAIEPQTPGEANPPEAIAEQEPPPTEPTDKVPRTVEELAGQTVKSSKEGLQKAGEAIGGTAKKAGEQIGNAGSAIGNAASKTWSCITSLFSSCGGDDANVAHPAPEPEPN